MSDREGLMGPHGPPREGVQPNSRARGPPRERLPFPNRVQGQPTGLLRNQDEETHILQDRQTLD